MVSRHETSKWSGRRASLNNMTPLVSRSQKLWNLINRDETRLLAYLNLCSSLFCTSILRCRLVGVVDRPPQVRTASWPGFPSRWEGHRASRNILERRENRCSSAGQFEGAGKDAILRAYMRHCRGSGCAETSPGLHDEEDANQFRNSGGCSLFHSGSGAPGNNTNTSRWCHFTLTEVSSPFQQLQSDQSHVPRARGIYDAL